MLHNERPVRPGRDRCVAVIGDDSALVGGEADALNSNAGYTECLRMEFGKEMEGSQPAGFGNSVISAFSTSSVRVVRAVCAGGECP